MKKLVIGALALITVSAMAVESANTVGYNEFPAATGTGFVMVGVHFEGVGAVDGKAYIGDVFNGNYAKNVSIENENFTSVAPHIQVPSGGGYDLYYYVCDAMNVTGVDANDDPIIENVAGWANDAGVLVSPENKEAEFTDADGMIRAGTCVWFKSPTASANIVNAGQVVADASGAVAAGANGFSMLAAPFPEDYDLNGNKVVFTGMAKNVSIENENFTSIAPHIQVPSGGGYDLYYYVCDAMNVTGVDANDDPIIENVAGWANDAGVLVSPENKEAEFTDADGIVPLGRGFWFKPYAATTVTFTK